MKSKKKWLLVHGLVWYALCGAGQTGPETTYNAFIEQVKKEHPLSKKAANLLLGGQLRQKSGNGFFDPQLDASSNNKYFMGSNYYAVTEAEIKQGLFAGQSIRAGYELGQGQFVNGESKTPVAGLPYVGLEVSLLQGLIMDKRRYELLKGRQYKNLSESESRILQNELLFDASVNYINWLRDYTFTDIHQRFMETAMNRFNGLVSLTKVGERPAIDTIEADVLLQTRKVELNNARAELNKSAFALKSFFWQNDSNALYKDLVPAEKISVIELNALALFLKIQQSSGTNNPALAFYRNKGELLTIEKRYRAELMKPKLDLKYNLLGQASGSDNSYNFYTNNYKWGFGFSMPLFLRTPVNNYKLTKLEIANNNYELKNKSAELENKLTVIRTNLSLLASQIEIVKNTLLYSRLLLDSEKVRFENNESSLFLLNTRESKVLESEIKLLEVQSKFILNYLYLIYLKGDMDYRL